MKDALTHAAALITTLHPRPHVGALVEITTSVARRHFKRYFTDTHIATEFAVESSLQGSSAFVGVNPKSAMTGFECDVAYVSALFLDLQPERTSIEGVASRMTAMGIPPSITCWSGNGAHMYLIIDPVEPMKAKPVWERLCKFTGSDPVFNVNRVARIPGTLNWKKSPPSWAYLTSINPERRYDVMFIESRLNAIGAPAARPAKEGYAVPVDPPEDWFELRHRLSEGVRDIIDSGERNAYSEKQISRSEADWVVVCALVQAGCEDAMIHWVYETQAVGVLKFREAGARYLNRTIEKARQAAAPTRKRSSTQAYDARRYRARGSAGEYARRTSW